MLIKARQRAKMDAVGIGYNSIDHLCILPHYPEYGSKSKMMEYSIQGGGQTATACAALSRFGFSTSYIGKFGSSPSGPLSEDSLKSWGVDTADSMHTDLCQNQIAVIWIDGVTGERTISYTRDDFLDISPDEIDKEAVCKGRLLLLDAHNIPAMIKAAKWAKESGIPTILDAERILPGIEDLLDLADYIITDQFFPERYTGIKEVEPALKEMAKHGSFIAATQGENGSIALVQGEFIHTKAIKVKSVDSTGAGDVFHAGFAGGLLLDMNIKEGLEFANVVAGLKCEKIGGRDGIPFMDEALKVHMENY